MTLFASGALVCQLFFDLPVTLSIISTSSKRPVDAIDLGRKALISKLGLVSIGFDGMLLVCADGACALSRTLWRNLSAEERAFSPNTAGRSLLT